jgi:RNA polymerase sigma-70 factor (ECF subfamily)
MRGVSSVPDPVDDAYRLGAAAFPRLNVTREAFAAYVASTRWSGDPERGADLVLCCACLGGVAGAAEELALRHLAQTGVYLARLRASPDEIAEVRQQLAVRLLTGERRALRGYSGRGPLGAWVRVAAVRTALVLRRGGARRRTWEEAAESRLSAEDGELRLLKEHYREPVRRAFAEAAAALPAEQRLLLRLHYVEGMTTAALATMHGVGRATLVRRLADARIALVEGTGARLRRALGVADGEWESVLRLVRSQLELGLSSLLRSSH